MAMTLSVSISQFVQPIWQQIEAIQTKMSVHSTGESVGYGLLNEMFEEHKCLHQRGDFLINRSVTWLNPVIEPNPCPVVAIIAECFAETLLVEKYVRRYLLTSVYSDMKSHVTDMVMFELSFLRPHEWYLLNSTGLS